MLVSDSTSTLACTTVISKDTITVRVHRHCYVNKAKYGLHCKIWPIIDLISLKIFTFHGNGNP